MADITKELLRKARDLGSPQKTSYDTSLDLLDRASKLEASTDNSEALLAKAQNLGKPPPDPPTLYIEKYGSTTPPEVKAQIAKILQGLPQDVLEAPDLHLAEMINSLSFEDFTSRRDKTYTKEEFITSQGKDYHWDDIKNTWRKSVRPGIVEKMQVGDMSIGKTQEILEGTNLPHTLPEYSELDPELLEDFAKLGGFAGSYNPENTDYRVVILNHLESSENKKAREAYKNLRAYLMDSANVKDNLAGERVPFYDWPTYLQFEHPDSDKLGMSPRNILANKALPIHRLKEARIKSAVINDWVVGESTFFERASSHILNNNILQLARMLPGKQVGLDTNTAMWEAADQFVQTEGSVPEKIVQTGITILDGVAVIASLKGFNPVRFLQEKSLSRLADIVLDGEEFAINAGKHARYLKSHKILADNAGSDFVNLLDQMNGGKILNELPKPLSKIETLAEDAAQALAQGGLTAKYKTTLRKDHLKTFEDLSLGRKLTKPELKAVDDVLNTKGNITIGDKVSSSKQLTGLQRNVDLQSAIDASKNPLVQSIGESIILAEDAVNRLTNIGKTISRQVWKTLPKDLTRNKGAKFFDLLESGKDGITGPINSALKYYRNFNENARVVLRDRIRLKTSKYYYGLKKSELTEAAAENGIKLDPGDTKEMIAEALTNKAIPKDWGKDANTYMPHYFFGEYQIHRVGKGGKLEFEAAAETLAEAKAVAISIQRAEPGASFKINNEIKLPNDFTYLPSKQLHAITNHLAKASELDVKIVKQAFNKSVRGAESRSPITFKSKLKRGEGFTRHSRDFIRAHDAYVHKFYQHQYMNDMTAEVLPKLLTLKSKGHAAWADHLTEALHWAQGIKRSKSSVHFDNMLKRMDATKLPLVGGTVAKVAPRAGEFIPFLGENARGFALDRMLGLVKSVSVNLSLNTMRFFALQELQQLQTLAPVVGFKSLYRAREFRKTQAGHDLLVANGLRGEARVGDKMISSGAGTAGRIDDNVKVIGGLKSPIRILEQRNQETAWLAVYDNSIRAGRTPKQAARDAHFRGRIGTQFARTAADTPAFMKGPILSTAMLYGNYPVKATGLMFRLAREGNYGGVIRFLGVRIALGGWRGVGKSIPLTPFGLNMDKETYSAIEQKYGETSARFVAHGLPGLAYLDVGTSAADVTFPEAIWGVGEDLLGGRATREIPKMMGEQVLGQPAQAFLKMLDAYANDNTALIEGQKTKKAWERVASAGIKSFPTLKAVDSLFKLVSKDPPEDRDSSDGLRAKQELIDVLAGVFAISSTNMDKLAMEAEYIRDLQYYMKDNIREATTIFWDEGIQPLKNHIKAFAKANPDFFVEKAYMRSLVGNIKSRKLRGKMTRNQLLFINASTAVKSKIIKDASGGN